MKEFKESMNISMREMNEIIKETREKGRIPKWNTQLYRIEFNQIMDELSLITDCPIMLSQYEDPLLAPSGHIYDDLSIQEIKNNDYKDPVTRERFYEKLRRKHYKCKDVLELLKKYSELTSLEYE